MSEADVPYAMAIGIFACMFGVILGFRYASASNSKSTSPSDPASLDRAGEELSRARGEYKDYRDSVDNEFDNINNSIKRLNAAYAALLDNFVQDAEKLCPDNQDALKVAANDRDLIAIERDAPTTEESKQKSA